MVEDTLVFPSSDTLPAEEERSGNTNRPRPPAGTVALVQIREDKLDSITPREGQWGPWMSLQWEIAEGEYKGVYASQSVNLDGTDHRFRHTFEVVTGIDISAGGEVSLSEFQQKATSGVFEAEVGPEKKKGEETGYTRVFKLTRRVRDRELGVGGSGADEEPIIGVADDTDIPF